MLQLKGKVLFSPQMRRQNQKELKNACHSKIIQLDFEDKQLKGFSFTSTKIMHNLGDLTLFDDPRNDDEFWREVLGKLKQL